MAYGYSDSREDTMSIDEFIALVDDQIDIFDEDSVMSAAPSLAALGRNKRALTEALNRELKGWRDFQSSNGYSGQTFILGAGKKQRFFIRANMWIPREAGTPVADWERKMFAYGLAHDHNFTLLTVGHFGAGYETDIYEYDARQLRGVAHESVDLKFLERTHLNEGRVLLFRKSRDIHIQGAPSEPSVSINLMIPSADATARQLFFDIEKGIAADVNEISPDRTEHHVCEMAALVGDARTQSLLHDLSQTSVNPLVREVCGRSLAGCVEEISAKQDA